MGTESKVAETAAVAVLFVIILGVSIGLALGTDLDIVVRSVVAIVIGLLGAAITFAALNHRR